MSDFKLIYKILALLDKHKGDEAFEYEQISAERLKTTYANWEQIMIELQENGLIRGLVYAHDLTNKFPHLVEPIRPVITLKGMEFLENNGTLSKAKEALKMLGDFV